MSNTVVKPQRVSISCICCLELVRRSVCRTAPRLFGEVHVAVPEPGRDHLALAIDDLGRLRYLDLTTVTDRHDLAITYHNTASSIAVAVGEA